MSTSDVGPCQFPPCPMAHATLAPLGTLVLLGAGLLGLAACSQAEGDLREWRPTDHKHQAESAGSNARAPQVSGSSEAPIPGLEEVTIAAWRRSCTSCHGQLGRGDGPQGAMPKARDLSDPAWQASVSDAQIAETIVKGRGTMPPFPLPGETVAGLVRLVRLFDREGRRPAPAAEAPAPSGASATTANPPGGARPASAKESGE